MSTARLAVINHAAHAEEVMELAYDEAWFLYETGEIDQMLPRKFYHEYVGFRRNMNAGHAVAMAKVAPRSLNHSQDAQVFRACASSGEAMWTSLFLASERRLKLRLDSIVKAGGWASRLANQMVEYDDRPTSLRQLDIELKALIIPALEQMPETPSGDLRHCARMALSEARLQRSRALEEPTPQAIEAAQAVLLQMVEQASV